MTLLPKLVLRQNQSLVMTPQLLQAIKLLQLSGIELEAHVAAELERNPLLERVEGDTEGPSPEAEGPAESGRAPSEPSWIEPVSTGVGEKVDADPADIFPDEPSRAPTVPDGPALGGWASVRLASSEAHDLEGTLAGERSLADHLSEQLTLACPDPQRRMIGAGLIALLDEAGYLRDPLDEIAARLGVGTDDVEVVLRLVQTFDPPGVFARDLAECLALQLAERDRLDPAMQALLAHLELVARRDYPALLRICAVDGEDLADMLAELKGLSPKPGMSFGGGIVQTMVPDVLVRAGDGGSWTVELNPDAAPRLLVNQTYYVRIVRDARNARDHAYLGECLQNANWLVRSLDQRARTILKVAAEIVRQQDTFLEQGIRHLRPLNLKDIAEAIGMHESTVSRVTANKSMATPRGIFDMKYFFTSAIAAAGGGESHSAEAVRHRIRQMIEAESPDGVLSDEVIVERLRDEGVEIARRTVAKYRESMQIPASLQRRREKTLQLA